MEIQTSFAMLCIHTVVGVRFSVEVCGWRRCCHARFGVSVGVGSNGTDDTDGTDGICGTYGTDGTDGTYGTDTTYGTDGTYGA